MGKKQFIFSLSGVTAHVFWVLLNSNVNLNCGMEKAVDPPVGREAVTQDQVS